MEHTETSMDPNNNEDPVIVTAHYRYDTAQGMYETTAYRRRVSMPGPAYTPCQVCRAHNAQRYNRPGPLQQAATANANPSQPRQ